jgi:non-specific serine/threonine protein kinase
MRKREESERRRLIAAICDREPIDWGGLRARRPELAALLDSLEALHGIASGSREILAELAREESEAARELAREPASATAAPAGAAPLFQWGKLRVLARLGAGGFGEVFRAFDPALEREVALKLRRPQPSFEPEEFLAEARRLARVRHPNVLAIHGADFHDGRLGMWTDVVEGRTLEQWIAADGPLGPREAARVGIDLCGALAAVHGAGLLHRDLKTTNVMREAAGRIVLMDFGAVIERGGAGRNLGTPASMAPEQLLGGRLSAATDLYGLGALLYRLVTRADPIESGSLAELRARHRRGALVLLRDRRADLPAGFCDIVEKALAARASERYASAGAMEHALAAWLGAESKAGAAPRTAPAAPDTPRPAVRLPAPLTTFVGRERESAGCMAALEQGRLVTLTGPGGCGKTRLAIRVAERLGEIGPFEIRFVDLVTVEEPARLPWAVAAALEVREERGRDLVETIAGQLAARETLIVVDNCEHLRGECARLVERLLRSCVRLRVLATSRERLGVPGERAYPVPPLSLPDAEQLERPEIAAHSEAVRLFLERAAAAAPDFQPAARDVAMAARIVTSLDGLPLAIELAAARVRVMSLGEIHDRLADRFKLLGGDREAIPARHSTLRATMQWSYDLLEERERRMLRALAVFAGGWTLEAARTVTEDGLDEIEALDRLTRLVDKSLVVVERPEGEATRYSLLETVRRFALEALADAGEQPAARERHRDHFLALAESAELAGPRLGAWLARLEADHENLLAALDACDVLADGAQQGLRLAGALVAFWHRRGHLSIGEDAVARALTHAGAELPTPARAFALHGAVRLAFEVRGARLVPRDAARLDECLELYRSFGDRRGVAAALNLKGFTLLEAGDHAAAARAFEEGLSAARETGGTWQISALLNNLGELARARGDAAGARARYVEALAVTREVGDPVRIAVLLANVVVLDVQRGALDLARSGLAESLGKLAGMEAPVAACTAIHAAAAVAGVAGEHERAARWFGAADARWQAIGKRPERLDAEAFAPIVARVRETLGSSAFEAALGSAASLSLEALVQETKEWAEAGRDAGPAHSA